ncbi:MAG: hypothetical protein II059_06795 [Clostridia bacterium]|nr:hypothetical protein [Clostridia bacterium]
MTKEEAIKWIEYHIDISDYDEDDDLLTALKTAVKALEKQRTGRWIEHIDERGDTYYECSSCKEEFTLIDGTPADNLYNYCSNCGAKMKRESED